MSIQDESFPVDAFLDELDFSPLVTTGQRFQFPHYQREQQLADGQATAAPTTTTTSPTQTATTNSSSEQNVSTESNNGRPLSGMSAKTSASDPDDNGSKKSEFPSDYRAQQKASSYQDIHSEYTKRRFKHVASKVGQYIANMKAEEQKRRDAKFQRHRSMPETLSGSETLLVAGDQKLSSLHYSHNELNRNNNLNVSNNSDADGDVESAANTTATTSASAATTNTNNSNGRHETSDDVSTGDFIDKQSYALLINEKERIQSYSDYLQTKLDEKISENMRLKRNVDYMRIELTSCQDKLKLKEKANSLGRLPLQSLLYCQAQSSKSTQTDVKTPSPLLPPRDLYITPDTPDANNNTMYDASTGNASKSNKAGGSNIQPLALNFSNIVEQDSNNSSGGQGVLRQRTNSNPTVQHSKTNNNNKNNNACAALPNNLHGNNSRSSSDSAIDIESVELSTSPKHKVNCARVAAHSTQSLRRGEEFIFYDKRSGRYATLQALNVGNMATKSVVAFEADKDDTAESSDYVNGNCRKIKKRNSLRRRWLRFIAPCTRCSDQHALDNSALQQIYTQIPLLEKSTENYCNNTR